MKRLTDIEEIFRILEERGLNPHPMYARLTPEQDKYPKERNWTEIHHYIPLTGDCFESIYFGVNIEPEVKEKMIRFALKKINPQINLYQMKVDADAFRLQPVKIIRIWTNKR